MITVATMSTVNPALILGAFALNGLYCVASALISLIAWLAPALIGAVAWVVVGLVGLVATHGRIVAMLAGLVAAVVLVAVFWQVLLVARVLGWMYAGLKLVTSL